MTPASILALTLSAFGGLVVERRLATRFPRPASILATLALLVSAPIIPEPGVSGVPAAALFALGAVAFGSLSAISGAPSRRVTILARGLIVAMLASLPTLVAVARAPWRAVYPDALLTALFGGEGLLYGGPLLWAGVLGLVALRNEDPALARLCLLAILPGMAGLVVDTGGADIGARCATWLPFLGPGIAALFTSLSRLTERRPARVVSFVGLLLVLWNALFMEQYRLLLIPNDNTASFSRITANSAWLLSRAVGTPFAWPANWAFAARSGLSPDRWDGLAGRRLFPDASATDAVIEIGDDDSPFAPDLPLLTGFGQRRTCGRGWCRDIYDKGRILLPLENPGDGDLTISVAARGEGRLRLTFDQPALSAAHELGDSMSDLSVAVPARLVRPGIHRLTLEVEGGGKATLDRIRIARTIGAASATTRQR